MIIDSDSKMLVVILVLVVILLGLAAFLFYLENRLSRSERQMKLLEDETNLKEANREKIADARYQ